MYENRNPSWPRGAYRQPDAFEQGGQTVWVTDFSYADVVERLFRECDGRLALPTIVEVVRDCLSDLQGHAPPEALAELLERSARQRLTTIR